MTTEPLDEPAMRARIDRLRAALDAAPPPDAAGEPGGRTQDAADAEAGR